MPFLKFRKTPMAAQPGYRPFNLMRWFSVTALLSVITVSALAASALSGFLTDRMVRQYAEVTADFVRSIVAAEDAYPYFDHTGTLPLPLMGDFLNHMTRVPRVLRINIYSSDRRMIWSSDATLIGLRFDRNDELDEALEAKLVVHSGVVEANHLPKQEHVHLPAGTNYFVESYVPILDKTGRRVLGVVELYKVPSDLFVTIREGQKLIWLMAAVAALFLYVALFWIVRRAHRMIESQQEKLIESEALAVVGEMGSAVAHGLRNPLASIRSSAELAMEYSLPQEARECTEDIASQVDRLEEWIRHLLTYAKPENENFRPVDINAVMTHSLATFKRDLERRRIAVRLDIASALPNVRGDEPLLAQLFGSLIANAVEAMDDGGEIVLASRRDQNGMVIAEIRDNGPGISREKLAVIFKPFYTSKPSGLGLGLPLVRRVVSRLGGKVEVQSSPGAGTAVRLHFPCYG